jgi:hypothetical protein
MLDFTNSGYRLREALACRCPGSSVLKISVCGGGVYVVLEEEREGYSSNVRWKK